MISSIMTIYLDLMIDVKAMIESLPASAPQSLKQGIHLSAIVVFQAYDLSTSVGGIWEAEVL